MPSNVAMESTRQAGAMTAASLPYLERQGSAVVPQALQAAQGVQGIQLNRLRMATEQLRQQDYAQRITLYHQELDLRQKLAATRQMEVQERALYLQQRNLREEADFEMSLADRVMYDEEGEPFRYMMMVGGGVQKVPVPEGDPALGPQAEMEGVRERTAASKARREGLSPDDAVKLYSRVSEDREWLARTPEHMRRPDHEARLRQLDALAEYALNWLPQAQQRTAQREALDPFLVKMARRLGMSEEMLEGQTNASLNAWIAEQNRRRR
jgi:hypothetical protein